MEKSPDAFRTISEVADWLGTPTHVLRFWESRFTQVKPVKRAGGRRYYRPSDMELLGGIKKLLHEDGMTIRGVQKMLREEGVKHVAALSPPLDMPADAAEAPYQDVPESSPTAEVVSFDTRRGSPRRRSATRETVEDAEPAEENATVDAKAEAPLPLETPEPEAAEPIADAKAPAETAAEVEAEAASEAAEPDGAKPETIPAADPVAAKDPEPAETGGKTDIAADADPALHPETPAATAPSAPQEAEAPDDAPAAPPRVDTYALLKTLAQGKRPDMDAVKPLYERLARLSVRMAAEPSDSGH